MKKWRRRIFLGLFILIIAILGFLHIAMSLFRFSDEKAMKLFQDNGFEGQIELLDIEGTRVKVIAQNARPTDSILMVFVHGAPGSWDAFKHYVVDDEIFEKARIVSYDRPGYGGSSKDAMPGIADQATILNGIIDTYRLKKVILVGHSYGCPIAAKAAFQNVIGIEAVVMIAPLIDPDNEPLFWYSYFSYWKLTSWMLPKDLVVAGSEKFAHASELAKMKEDWASTSFPIYHVHGLKDVLAPGKENVAFSEKFIPKIQLQTEIYPDKGHLIIWTEYDLMKDILLRILKIE